jgi:hypothetical protein
VSTVELNLVWLRLFKRRRRAMSLDTAKILSELGDDLIAQAGEPVGLNRDQSVRVARALTQHLGKGREAAVQQAAADTGLTEEVISAMLGKLIETGRDKLLNEGPVGQAIDSARAQAGAAIGQAGQAAARSVGGMLGGLLGRK